MTILNLGEIGDYLYCPITGKAMLGEIDPEVVPSVIAFWSLEVPEEPTFIKDDTLKSQWEGYISDLDSSNANNGEYDQEYPDPEEFLSTVESTNMFCIKAYQYYGGLIIFDTNRAIESLES